MSKASEVASELRKLADALDREPEANVRHPWISFYCQHSGEKEAFMNLARILPRPLKKEYDNEGKSWDRLRLVYGDVSKGPIHVELSIHRSSVCRMIRPAQEAVYDCKPVLSKEEEEQLI